MLTTLINKTTVNWLLPAPICRDLKPLSDSNRSPSKSPRVSHSTNVAEERMVAEEIEEVLVLSALHRSTKEHKRKKK